MNDVHAHPGVRRRAERPLRVEAEIEAEIEAEPVGRSREWLDLAAPMWTWASLGLAAVGFALIVLCWGRVAGETEVYRQLPYVISAGFLGVGLIVVGLSVLGMAVRLREAAGHDEAVERLIAGIDELKERLG